MRALLVPFLCAAVLSCGGNEATDDTPSAACSDGVDNDNDGNADFPDDLGCVSPTDDTEDSPTQPKCNDGRDNDGDGNTDYPDDPGCFAPAGDAEEDDCPDGPFCPQCGNGKDDDMNGATDYPEDQGCESAADASEFLNNPVACGPNMKIKQLPTTGMETGMLDGTSTSTIQTPCGSGAGSPAIAYVFQLSTPKVIQASTDDSGTTADTVLDIRKAACADPGSEIACSDDIDGTNTSSSITMSLQAGTYYLIVSGHDSTEQGSYTLYVQFFAGEGETCTGPTDCGPGLVCRVQTGETEMKCLQPMCNDGIDNDGDNKTDYPNDPGCPSPNSNDEFDTCPNQPNCPECSDGIDNDNDGMTDYPNDTTCAAAGDASESCISSEGVEPIVQKVTTGTTVGATNDFDPTCDSGTGLAPDKVFRLDLPGMSSLTVNTTGFDVAQSLLGSSCSGTALTCSDPELFTQNNLAAGTYYLVVDGYFTTSQGNYTITVGGTIANNQPCDNSPLLLSGAFTCNAGFACKGATVGQKTCQVAQCNDGIDNNNNGGKKDFPQDPGCTSLSDDTETTVCPGVNCPVCSDGQDNDNDMATDFPNDPSCVAASGTSESCVSTEGVGTLTTAATAGDTSTGTDDIKLTCASSSSTGKDAVYQFQVPMMQSLTFNLTAGFDSATAVLGASCLNPSLACTDPNVLTMSNVAAGTYFYVVDGWSTGSGPFTINVSGVIANGQRCDNMPLSMAGALTCGPAFACKGPAGNKTCQPAECSDGMDNNGDGKKDYPNDPGCSSPSDGVEDTVCPGAMCPVCANGTDDDGDMVSDFPMDFGCAAAGGMNETFCTGEPDFGGVISAMQTAGNLMTTADNYDQTCQSSTGNDTAFALQLPVPVVSLQIDTNGSTVSDTVISMKDAQCGTDLGCDDDGGDGFQSLMTLSNVAAGNYAVQVDGFSSSNNGAFVLNVKGTVAAQTACTSPLFAAGVLVCPTGTTCTGGKCQ